MDYRQAARDAASRYGIDPEMFLRLIQQESRFRPDEVSPKGAIGLGQLMPATAKELGVDPTDPLQNLEGAAKYLSQQFKRFEAAFARPKANERGWRCAAPRSIKPPL